jgi:hypothetical protein
MNTAKIYHDTDGNKCSIWQMIKREPDWVANVFQTHESTIDKLRCKLAICEEILRAHDPNNKYFEWNDNEKF